MINKTIRRGNAANLLGLNVSGKLLIRAAKISKINHSEINYFPSRKLQNCDLDDA